MYRKPDGKMGVSFTRFMNNAAPSIMVDSTKDPGHVSLPQKDSVYAYQITSNPAKPEAFNEGSLWSSSIIDNEAVSKKAFHKLQAIGALDADGCVDTTKIGPRFTHDMALISAVRQKQIIDLLFWWEEESHRLRKLRDERAELEVLVAETTNAAAGGEHTELRQQLTLLLDRVNLKMRQLPSERREDMERDEDEVIQRYRNGLLPDAATAQDPTGEQQQPPPAYSS